VKALVNAGGVVVDGVKSGGDGGVGEGCHESGLALIEVAEQLDQSKPKPIPLTRSAATTLTNASSTSSPTDP